MGNRDLMSSGRAQNRNLLTCLLGGTVGFLAGIAVLTGDDGAYTAAHWAFGAIMAALGLLMIATGVTVLVRRSS